MKKYCYANKGTSYCLWVYSQYGDWRSSLEFDEAYSSTFGHLTSPGCRSAYNALIYGPRGWVFFVNLSKLRQSPYCDSAVVSIIISIFIMCSITDANRLPGVDISTRLFMTFTRVTCVTSKVTHANVIQISWKYPHQEVGSHWWTYSFLVISYLWVCVKIYILFQERE